MRRDGHHVGPPAVGAVLHGIYPDVAEQGELFRVGFHRPVARVDLPLKLSQAQTLLPDAGKNLSFDIERGALRHTAK